MLMTREAGHEAMMSNLNNQGIPYEYDSKDNITMMLTIMALFNEQQQNDVAEGTALPHKNVDKQLEF